jgi:hypothetical protein
MFDPSNPAEAVAALERLDEGVGSSSELVAGIEASARAIAWLQARQIDLIAELAERPSAEPALPEAFTARELAALEVGPLLALSAPVANERVDLAVELSGPRSATLAALRRGDLDWSKARALADAVAVLPPEIARRVEDDALIRAGQQTCAQLRASLRRLVARHDPLGAECRHQARRAERSVCLRPLDDGMAELLAILPADAAVAAYAAVDALAKTAEDNDDRGIDARRADALVGLLLSASGVSASSVSAAGVPAAVQVAVPAGTLLGLGDEPGWMPGYGPIPASMARDIARSATWQRILFDPVSGTVLDVGATRHDPPAHLERVVRARDAMCRFPGCRARARRCDVDHTTPYPHGPTSADNLHVLCRRHHRVKHDGGWRVEALPGNRLRWRSPTGAVYETEPPPLGGESCTIRGPALTSSARRE